MKGKTLRIIVPLIVAMITSYTILDYINVPSLIGISLANINIDMFSVFFDTCIVLVLYVISFFYIENKQNEKDANSRDTVIVLLKKTYQECFGNLELLDNRGMVGEYIIPKVDGNKPDSENKVVHNLQTLPFSTLDALIDLAANGYVEKKKFEDYLEIKKEYQYLVSIKITFYDLVNPVTADQKAMHKDIKTRDAALRDKLKELTQGK